MTTTYQKSVIFLLKHDPFSVLYDKSGNLEQWDLERKVLTFNDIWPSLHWIRDSIDSSGVSHSTLDRCKGRLSEWMSPERNRNAFWIEFWVKDFKNFLCNFRKTIVTGNGRGSLESMLKRDEEEQMEEVGGGTMGWWEETGQEEERGKLIL